MKVDKKTITSTSRLANIAIPEREADKYEKEFNKILSYIEKLNELDTEGVQPTSYVGSSKTPLRKDERISPLKKETALANHPHRKGSFFTVPKFIEQ